MTPLYSHKGLLALLLGHILAAPRWLCEVGRERGAGSAFVISAHMQKAAS